MVSEINDTSSRASDRCASGIHDTSIHNEPLPAADEAIQVVCPSVRRDAQRLLGNSGGTALRKQLPHTNVTPCLTFSFVRFEFFPVAIAQSTC